MSYYILIRGPLGIGKTTIAKELEKKLDAIYISFDKVLEDNGLDKKDDGFTPQDFIKANEIAVNSLAQDLKSKKIIIFDGCFYFKEQIDDIKQRMTKINGYKEFAFTLKAPVETCIVRDSKRKRVYGADAAKFVYAMVNAFDYGTNIQTDNKTKSQVVQEILIHLNN